jgi:hypothetical protein
MTRARGRCDRGERLRSKAPFGHWKTQTFVAGLRCGALTAPWVTPEECANYFQAAGYRFK